MNKTSSPVLVVGVGTSAGGLDALKRFFTTVPKGAPIAFIVVQHLDPNHKSMMVDILSRHTPFSFCQGKDRQVIEAGMAYLIPPDAYIEVSDNNIRIIKPQHKRGSRLAIDHLFRSMANMYKNKAVGLLFSGSGSDGTAGLRALKANGGLSLVQNPQQAEYPSMPRSAIEAGVVDQVVDVENIYALLLQYSKYPHHQITEVDEDEKNLATISSILKTHENFDVDLYKQSTVQRRLLRRMSLTGNDAQEDYVALLHNNADERLFLMRDLLINVTDFFRDKDAFELISEKVIRNIVAGVNNGEEIRVWVAGCASGEEAYTFAILFTQEIARYQKGLTLRIFATDVDEEAIKIARKGVYSASIASQLPNDYLENYFTLREDGHYAVRKSLRDCISFAHQNVYTDPPFSKLHLVSCRNLLIYLRKNVQQKVLQSFFFSLLREGFLFLGSSENLGEQKEAFTPISEKWRIYQRHEKNNVSDQASVLPGFFNTILPMTGGKRERERQQNTRDKSHLKLLHALKPSVLLDENNNVVYFHGNLAAFLTLPDGNANLNFLKMIDKELRTRMQSAMFKAKKVSTQIQFNPPSHYLPSGKNRTSFSCQITPVIETNNVASGLVISFTQIETNVSETASAQEMDDSQGQETIIDSLQNELGEIREELQNTNEALESNTEELKAAHEEALSTNEELQSSNEELEASTEELRSLNEELTTVNAQLKDKIDELSSTHDDIKNFLSSTNLATVFLSNELKIKRYTPAAQRLLNIGLHQINSSLNEIFGQFIDEKTYDKARLVLDSLEPSEIEVKVGDRWFVQKILPYQTEDKRVDGVVLTFNEITHLKHAVDKSQVSGRQHAVIAALGIKALSTDNMERFTDQLVREVAHTLNADFSKVLEYFPEQDQLLVRAGVGWDAGVVGEVTVDAKISSQAGFTLNASEPLIFDDLDSEQRFTASALLTEHKIKSGISCIIASDEHPFGTLAVYTVNSRKFTQDDANFLVSAANILSVALHRTAVEAKLRESERRLRIAKNSNAMGSFELTFDSGELYWDQLLLDIWGLNKEEANFEAFREGVHADDIARVDEAIGASTQLKDNGHYMATYRVINKLTQKESSLEATGQVIFKDEKPYKMIGMVIDITEKMKLESSLKAAVQELQEANEKKNEFLATLGHEIRNPLAAIASGIQIIERDKQQLERATSMIDNNVKIVSSLLDDLLDLTRISRGQIELKKERLNFNDLVSSVYQSFLSRCEQKQQQISLTMPPTDIFTYADRTRLQQAISNIVNNAYKFTPNGGAINIDLRCVDEHIQLNIKDNGIGFDMQFNEKIFEPFHQLKNSQSIANSGLGIGLSLVKQFVLLHDGSVSVTSEGLNKGCIFKIEIPIVSSLGVVSSNTSANKDDSFQHSHTSSVNDFHGCRVLIVDDNEDAAYGLSLILSMKGCQVHTCYTGGTALAEISEFAPNILILDIGLPDITGYELLKVIKKTSSKSMLSIALTGYGHKEAKQSSKKAGFDFHMTKPVDIERLMSVMLNNCAAYQT